MDINPYQQFAFGQPYSAKRAEIPHDARKPAHMSDRDFNKITATAQDFEANFLANMMRPMFKELSTGGLFGGGHAESVFRDLLIEEYGKSAAKTGGIGIADHVTKQLINLQSGGSHGSR